MAAMNPADILDLSDQVKRVTKSSLKVEITELREQYHDALACLSDCAGERSTKKAALEHIADRKTCNSRESLIQIAEVALGIIERKYVLNETQRLNE